MSGKADGSQVVLLGTRYDESATRARSVRKHEGAWELNPHSTLRHAWVFAPIKALMTEEVWEFLTTNPPPWGGSHLPLRNMYRDANAASLGPSSSMMTSQSFSAPRSLATLY